MSIPAIRELFDSARARKEPVLTMYLDINPAHGDDGLQAVQVRARSTMASLQVPRELADRVAGALAHSLLQGRTLIIIAEPEAEPELTVLDVELPVIDSTTGHVEARWGRPYVTPLLLAIDRSQRFGALYVDRDHWRFFVVRLNAIEEVEQGTRTPTPSEGDALEPSKQVFPSYVPTRGGAAHDDAEHHVNESARRAYKQLAQQITNIMSTSELEGLILLGPEEYRHLFESAAPDQLSTKIVARLPALSRPDAPSSEVLERASEVIAAVRECQHARLLDDIAEHGLVGLATCLGALQESRVDTLAVQWPADFEVYRCATTGHVAPTEAVARARTTGTVQRTPLHDVLPDLAEAYNVRIVFLHGSYAERLRDEMSGIAALPRW